MKIELQPGEGIYIYMGEHVAYVRFNEGRNEPDILLFSDDPVEFNEAEAIGYNIAKPAYSLQVMKEGDRPHEH